MRFKVHTYWIGGRCEHTDVEHDGSKDIEPLEIMGNFCIQCYREGKINRYFDDECGLCARHCKEIEDDTNRALAVAEEKRRRQSAA